MGLPSKAAWASNICLKDRNEIVFNNTNNCSISKSFFSNLAQNLVSKLPPSPNVFTESKVASYYNDIKYKDLIFEFSEASPEKLLNILKGLNPSKAADIVNLSRKFLKDDAYILARPISQLYNLSIKLNLFPRSCKIAKVKPLFKKGSKTDPKNYRPISLLPILSKTIERIIPEQTQELLSKSKILYRFQHLSRTSNWLKLLPDLKKVFLMEWFWLNYKITINIQISIKKMKYLGFSKNVIAWYCVSVNENLK